MNGNTSIITTEQRNWIVKYEEGQLGDVKGIDISPSKLSETISALANADGGELWIGIDEDEKKRRTWRGFETVEDANARYCSLEKVIPLNFLNTLRQKGLYYTWKLRR